MKMRSKIEFAAVSIFALVASEPFARISEADSSAMQQQEPRLSGQGLYDTRIGSLQGPVNIASPEASEATPPSGEVPFVASPYTVVNRATPTSTRPEAEEEISVDPTNSSTLVAAISDFSLRGGYNTTKYAFSLSNGAPGTWMERFVPLMNGYPVTAKFPLTGATQFP